MCLSISESTPAWLVFAGFIWKRQYGDLSNLSWLRKHAKEVEAQQAFAASNGGGYGSSQRQHVQVQAYQVSINLKQQPWQQ